MNQYRSTAFGRWSPELKFRNILKFWKRVTIISALQTGSSSSCRRGREPDSIPSITNWSSAADERSPAPYTFQKKVNAEIHVIFRKSNSLFYFIWNLAPSFGRPLDRGQTPPWRSSTTPMNHKVSIAEKFPHELWDLIVVGAEGGEADLLAELGKADGGNSFLWLLFIPWRLIPKNRPWVSKQRHVAKQLVAAVRLQQNHVWALHQIYIFLFSAPRVCRKGPKSVECTWHGFQSHRTNILVVRI